MPLARLSAGILLYRRRETVLDVLLVHPGGPLWRNKDKGAWMIPKGLVEPGEDLLAAALREFEEEVGTRPTGVPVKLPSIREAGGKQVVAFALAGDLNPELISSNRFEMEWPRGSGRLQSFPEIDQACWFTMSEARAAMLPSQIPLLDHLMGIVA